MVYADGIQAYTVPVSLEEIKDAVAKIRAGLDLSNVRSLSEVSSFDTTLAFELYEKQFKPAEKMLQGVKHLFVEPTGPLQSFPLGVLATSKPKKPAKLADYQDVQQHRPARSRCRLSFASQPQCWPIY